MRKIYFLFLLLILNISFITAQTIKGRVLDEKGEPLAAATVVVNELQKGVSTDNEGRFRLTHLPNKVLTLEVSFIGYANNTQNIDLTESNDVVVHIKLEPANDLNTVEVFGERYKQPEKLDAITRMPLRPSEQIQSISVISDKVIAEQGALTITDAVRNVPGVTLFGSYGGVKESMSSRGFRGIPVLKNGVRMDSQLQTASGIADMQGVESIQMIKGSAAVTQGVITDLGNAGGVINVVTKTPKFVNGGEVGVRVGSWGQFRPTFDVQSVLNKDKTIAFRLNGAYERSDNYRPVVSKDRVYINPSLEWRPDVKTTVNLELDYLNDNTTPVTSTVNFANIGTEALYDMPHSKFLGIENDNVNTELLTYSARVNRKLTENFSVRAAYFNSSYNVDNVSTALDTINVYGAKDLRNYEDPRRKRTTSRSLRDDKNTTFQLDFIGRDVYTGPLKHTFQLGFDYRIADATTKNLGSSRIDVIDVKNGDLDNSYQDIKFLNPDNVNGVRSRYTTYGIMAQEVLTFNKYLKAILGLRYSSISTTSTTATNSDGGIKKEDAWDPIVGVMVSPIKDLNLFASYTTSTSLRSAANIIVPDTVRAGAAVTKQFEVGIKSDWLDNRLRFNLTYFHIESNNLTNTEYRPGTTQSTGYFYEAGDLVRDGIEVELNGRILSNLQVMLGYAYLDAKYKNSPSYVNGSAPINAPKHTANGWAYYTVDKGPIKGLSVGLGAYYVGKRPVNEYSTQYDGHSYNPGVKPFDMPAYTTVNVQLAYTYKKVTTRMFFNNIFDELGYNSYYRGGYINQIDPRNFAAVVSYRF